MNESQFRSKIMELVLAEQHYKTDAAEHQARAARAIAEKLELERDVFKEAMRKAGYPG